MVIKTVSNSDVGTSDVVGGDDWDAVASIINNYTATPDFATYFIYKTGSTYYARNGLTKVITSNADASTLIQSVLTAMNTTGGIIQFTQDNFQLVTPLDIATATFSSVKPIIMIGVPTTWRANGTVLEATSAFPTDRALIETSGGTDGANKGAALYIQGINFVSQQYASINVNGIKFEVDTDSVQRALVVRDCYMQYLYRGIDLIGSVWWSQFNNIHFSAFNATYVGDCDIKLSRGAHANVKNFWPKFCEFRNISVVRSPGSVVASLNIQDGGYNTFYNYSVDGYKYTDAVFLFQNANTNSCEANIMYNPSVIDMVAPSPDNTRGCVVFDGAGVFGNAIYAGQLPKNMTYAIGYKNSPYRNYVQTKGFWGTSLAIDDTSTGADNVLVITPGDSSSTPAKPTITGAAGLTKIIDHRKGFAADGLSATQSGDGTTKVFNIAHGLYAAPAYALATAYSTDSLGSFTTTSDATNVIITYSVAPPSGTNNLRWYWRADDY